jgi:hypothetical protein
LFIGVYKYNAKFKMKNDSFPPWSFSYSPTF